MTKVEEEKKEEINQCTAVALREEDKGTEQRIVDVRSTFIKLDYKSLPNFHKKLIFYNLPSKVNDDEIKNYILTLLTTLNPVQRETNPIQSYQIMEEGLYYIFEFALKDDIDILVNMDQTDWRGYRIRVKLLLHRYKNQKGSILITTTQKEEMLEREKTRKTQAIC